MLPKYPASEYSVGLSAAEGFPIQLVLSVSIVLDIFTHVYFKKDNIQLTIGEICNYLYYIPYI